MSTAGPRAPTGTAPMGTAPGGDRRERPAPRPALRPGLAVLWRPDGTVQLGTSPRSSVLLTGLDEVEQELLALLALHRPVTSADRPPQWPTPRSPGAVRAQDLLRSLDAHGAVAREPPQGPAPSPARAERWTADVGAWAAADPDGPCGPERIGARLHRRVVVLGGGRTGAGIATTLAASGVGEVVVVDRDPAGAGDLAPAGAGAEDLGGSRALAAHRAVARTRRIPGEEEAPAPRPGAGTALVVLVHHGVADAGAADGLVAEGLAHLSVVVRDTDVLVGPLVLPGRTPCLRCLDLHRTDRDAGWPHVVTQVLSSPAHRRPGEETATATAAAGLAALQVLAHLDGAAVSSRGATLELLVPEALVRMRPWSVHPQCGCAEIPLSAPGAGPPGSGLRRSPGRHRPPVP